MSMSSVFSMSSDRCSYDHYLHNVDLLCKMFNNTKSFDIKSVLNHCFLVAFQRLRTNVSEVCFWPSSPMLTCCAEYLIAQGLLI